MSIRVRRRRRRGEVDRGRVNREGAAPKAEEDRIHRDESEISHEFLSMMLGCARPSGTIVAGMLQKAGLIHYTHGRITITDRSGLEQASCECYRSVKCEFDRLGL